MKMKIFIMLMILMLVGGNAYGAMCTTEQQESIDSNDHMLESQAIECLAFVKQVGLHHNTSMCKNLVHLHNTHIILNKICVGTKSELFYYPETMIFIEMLREMD